MKRTNCPICKKDLPLKGITLHTRACKVLNENKSNIISLYSQNFSLRTIGKRFGVDSGGVSKFLKENGVLVKSGEDGKYKNHNSVDGTYFSKIDSDEKAWLLGLLAADGCVTDEGSIKISQSGKNGLRLIEYVKELLKITTKITTSKTIGEDAHGISVRSWAISKQLSKYNIVPRKSLKYTFPTHLPKKYYSSFIRGYIDGDGCIGVYNNGNGYMSLSASFVGTPSFIRHCLQVIPIKGTLSKCSGSNRVLEIRWWGRNAQKFCEWVYSIRGIYESYKYEKYKNHIESLKNNLPEYVKYDFLKRNAEELLEDGYSGMEIGKILKIPFQTVYKWKNKYENRVR